jgi:polar amino acid transport system substrate-binding protein
VLVATFGITPERPPGAVLHPLQQHRHRADVCGGTQDRRRRGPGDAQGGRGSRARKDTAISGVVPQGTRIMRFDDDATTAQALLSNQIDAIGVNTITAQQIQTMNPQAKYEAKFVLRHQPNGITVRCGQTDLHQWINTFINFIKNNGELDAIHRKWLNAPLPELPVF